MRCRYCQALNQTEDRRCGRCGRRLHLAAPPPAAGTYPISTSVAPALAFLPRRDPASPPPEPVRYQPPLFRDVPGGPKVIPIPTLTPLRPRAREESPQPRRANRPAGRRTPDSQQSLNLQNAAALGTHVEAVIYCDAPVASPTHRFLAAAIDASFVLVAAGVFLAIFFISGGVLAFTKQNVPFFAGVAILLTLLYKTLWYLANGDSPGMRLAGLRLVDFDGRAPDREHRGLRQIASVLSFGSAGLGLVWALVDEENLTWHDHISKTFPTAG